MTVSSLTWEGSHAIIPPYLRVLQTVLQLTIERTMFSNNEYAALRPLFILKNTMINNYLHSIYSSMHRKYVEMI